MYEAFRVVIYFLLCNFCYQVSRPDGGMLMQRCGLSHIQGKVESLKQLNEEWEMFSQSTQGFLIAEPETRSGGEIRIMSPHK